MKYLPAIIFTLLLGACKTAKQPVAQTTILNGDTLQLYTGKTPACIQALIKEYEANRVENPPRRVYSYTYNGQEVFYIPPICCDIPSIVFNGDCKTIGSPDGGFTGRGDGTMTDFHDKATNRQLVWADRRKP